MGELGDEPSDGATGWGPIVVAALAYVAVGAWDWTDTVEALARYGMTLNPADTTFIGMTLYAIDLFSVIHPSAIDLPPSMTKRNFVTW